MILKTYSVSFCRMDRIKVTYKNGDIQYKECDPDYLNNYRGETFEFTNREELKQDLSDYFSPGDVHVDIEHDVIYVRLVQAPNNLRPIDQAFIDSVRAGKCCEWEMIMGCDARDVEGLGEDQCFFDIPSTKKEVTRLGEEAHQRLLGAWNEVWEDRGEEAPPLTKEVEDCILRALDWDHTTFFGAFNDIVHRLKPYAVETFNDFITAYAVVTGRSEEFAKAKYAAAMQAPNEDLLLVRMFDEIVFNADVYYVDDTAGYDHLVIMYNY